jgi:hypothetical protein
VRFKPDYITPKPFMEEKIDLEVIRRTGAPSEGKGGRRKDLNLLTGDSRLPKYDVRDHDSGPAPRGWGTAPLVPVSIQNNSFLHIRGFMLHGLINMTGPVPKHRFRNGAIKARGFVRQKPEKPQRPGPKPRAAAFRLLIWRASA